MTEFTTLSQNQCPGCGKETDAEWFVCPHCGLRLKPAQELLQRSLIWVAILLAFVLIEVAVSQKDRDLANMIAIFVGLPLAYTFGKAVLFRIVGRPLTWNQLGWTSARALKTTFVFLVVLPLAIGVSLLIFLFLLCSPGLLFPH